MSTVSSTSTSESNFASFFNAALDTYKRKTKKDLASHPLLPRLQSCNSPEAILTVLHEEIPFNQSENGDNRLTDWVMPTVKVLLAFSATVGQGVGQVSIRIFLREDFLFLYPHSGTPTGGCHIRWVRRSPLSQCRSCLPSATGFHTRPRRLKMIALAETSSSTSSIALNTSSGGLRHISVSNRLWL